MLGITFMEGVFSIFKISSSLRLMVGGRDLIEVSDRSL